MAEEKALNIEEEKMVEEAFQHLIDSYLSTKHRKKVDIITKAFNFARHAHQGGRRLSGEPYIMHPLAVAQIVCTEIGLGSTSICSALLHDVVEDTDYTIEDIENIFGPKIAQIVDGLTKISGGIFGERASAQAENFKKLLLTMNDDIRVILIKMADRLHNMRTLGAQPANKRYKISGETLYIYAPLANRLGLNAIKSELENLSFKYEHPDEYKAIEKKLQATESERNTVFQEFTAPIRKQLDQMGFNYEIKARIKSPYSIWSKMQVKHIPFEEVYDILAVRIIFEPRNNIDERNECFNIYVALTQLYSSHPDRFRDWVNHPKANGYKALHVTLMSNLGEWIEVQIRSQKMDDIAEKGFAAHWKYKEGEATDEERDNELDKWLVTIKEILDDPQPDAMDFLDTIKLNLYASEILVFTPKGEIKILPTGATALDFAFSIHTVVGTHCMGAKVNHKLVPMTYRLQGGDQVEILTSFKPTVTDEWLNIATTAKAKAKILAAIRKKERLQQREGEEMLDEFLAKCEIIKDTPNIDKLCHLHSFAKAEELYLAIGQKKVVLGNMDESYLRGKNNNSTWKRLLSFGRKKQKEQENKPEKQEDEVVYDKKKPLVINDTNIDAKFCLDTCCNPIPGDLVMAYQANDGMFHVHKLQCPAALRLKANSGNRLFSVKWDVKGEKQFAVTIKLDGFDRIGILNQITQVISQLFNANIRKLTVETIDGVFDCTIVLFVHNTKEVQTIIKDLKKIPNIKNVVRI
ncbi:MAG: RelA/SpoT family protein [Bacteroidaceae bacterium]|nr:bifunctional (p)ppGpp synthetase/guanosine-3',5'-bis(diphosphate) 3'-pyrophosphohydrolase [Bacteroidaceae bacterium]MCR4834949.1 RelA/SpoT family protein [Bacteroidaceae bacterium]